MKKENIYLAIPYSGIEEISFKAVNAVAAQLMLKGHIVYSPISQGHAIVQENSLPNTREFWEKSEESFISWCDKLFVVVLIDYDGTELIKNSKGCQSEISMANTLNKPIDYFIYA